MDDDTSTFTHLSVGLQLGPYRIEGPIGAGGMGEVFRAQDTRLGRTVAIKVLPADKFSDPERRRRFLQEAKAASALNHANIVVLYDISTHSGTDFLVLEYVEGKTLKELITAQGMPLPQVLQYGVQTAEALAAAHEKGIVHRDLKPANIMVTRDSLVKVLDFGLAKLDVPTSPGGELTHVGEILGTAGYMSPQQANGEPVDFRSDQFSLGVVLYEMVTGKRPFQRSTTIETLVAILRAEPEPIAKVNPRVPTPLVWIIERCLAKNPENRYPSSRDLARELAVLRNQLSEPPPQATATRPSPLPVQRTPFIGRDDEAAAVRELLREHNVRLVTLTGPPGTGKTRLAVRVAEELSEQFGGNLFYAALASVTDPDLVAPAIAQALDVSLAGGRSLGEVCGERLAELHCTAALLFLDNFEQLLPEAPVVTELMAACRQLKVLVTSRAPLKLYGEHEFPVPTLAPDAALNLFLDRATATKPDFSRSPDNLRAAAEICARLDGLPLAIELAAARIKMLPPQAMLSRLESRLQFLTSGPRDLPARQQTLRSAIDWSHGLLSEAEQKLFRRLSIFVGGCTLESAEAVCDSRQDLGLNLFDGLASLVDKSLVRQVETGGEEPRFTLLETIREYGLERLTESGELPWTRRAHAAYCLVLAEEAAPALVGPAQPMWLSRMDVEHDNLRAALERLIDDENAEWGLRLGRAIQPYWWLRQHGGERGRLERLLKLPSAAPRTKARALALEALSWNQALQGDFVGGKVTGDEAKEIYRELGDQESFLRALSNDAATAGRRGDYAGARALLEESIKLWRERGDEVSAAYSMNNLADLARVHGEYGLSRSLYEECRSVFQSAGDSSGAAWSFNHQGDLAREQGEFELARTLYDEGLAIFREMDDARGMAISIKDLAALTHEQGDHIAAACLYQEALKRFWEMGHRGDVARVLEDLGSCCVQRNLFARGLTLAGAAAAVRKSLGAPVTAAAKIKLEENLEPARRKLGPQAATAWMKGWAMPLQETIDFALEPESSGSLSAKGFE